MRDNVSIIITVIILVTVLLLFPLYNYFERQDDMTYNIVLKATTNFVDEVVSNGYITQETYDKYINRLSNTGYSYNIDLEVHRRVLTRDPNSTLQDPKYIEQYEIKFNKDIFEESGKTQISGIKKDTQTLKNEAYLLNEADQFYVRVKNRNTTMAGAILNLLTPSAPKEKIDISYGGMIKNTTWANTVISDLYQSDIMITMELEEPNEADEKNAYPLYTLEVPEDRTFTFKVKVANADDNGIAIKLADNMKLVGDNPNIYISPDSITSNGNEEYLVKFVLEESKIYDYLGENTYNRFHLFIPANMIQGIFSKNTMKNSDYIILRDTLETEIPTI